MVKKMKYDTTLLRHEYLIFLDKKNSYFLQKQIYHHFIISSGTLYNENGYY